jgi:hypothetical protein
MPTWTQFGNTVAWMVLVVLAAAALGAVWGLTGFFLSRRSHEDWWRR